MSTPSPSSPKQGPDVPLTRRSVQLLGMLCLGACTEAPVPKGAGAKDAGAADRGVPLQVAPPAERRVHLQSEQSTLLLNHILRTGFMAEVLDIHVQLSTGASTSEAVARLCAGEVDVVSVARPIRRDQLASCERAGVELLELPVGLEDIVVLVPSFNTWAASLTAEELRRIWRAHSPVVRWRDVRPQWPAAPLRLYGPDPRSDTGTDFAEGLLGHGARLRGDYTRTESGDALAAALRADPLGLGFVNNAYFVQHQEALRRVEVVGVGATGPRGAEASPPSTASAPPALARPLILYVARASMDQAHVQHFVAYYVGNAVHAMHKAGAVHLSARRYRGVLTRMHERRTGTMFSSGTRPADLLRAE